MNTEMNKEQQELLDEAFNQFSKYKMENFGDTRWDVIIEMNTSDNTKPYFVTGRPLIKEEFIEKCKTDSEFSQRWGLKIEEQTILEQVDQNNPMMKGSTALYSRKLITVTYNDKTIKNYEQPR